MTAENPLIARRTLLAAGLAVPATLALASCASGSVADQAGASSSSGGEGTAPGTTEGFDAILPEGDPVAFSKDLVATSLEAREGFVPPSSGPSAQQAGATIAFVGSDLSNGGVNATAAAVREAAAVIGWGVDVFDGQANPQGITDAMDQAVTSGPAAIILGGPDPTEQAPAIATATDAGLPVIGWHAGVLTAPGNGLFTNVTTDPLKVSQLAAAYAVADSDGTAGVAIFTDGQYAIAVQKARAMEAYVQAVPGCTVLAFEDSPIVSADQRMPGLVSNLLQRHGEDLGYLLAINGNYFSGAATALRDAGRSPDGPPKNVAAGDGDAAEFQRIRNDDYQSATVAEPITLQGWQLVDEVNRALAGEEPSGFVAPPGLVTRANVPDGDVFDPDSDYREVYTAVWDG